MSASNRERCLSTSRTRVAAEHPWDARTVYLRIIRVRDGVVMQQRPIFNLDPRYVLKAVREWTRGEQLSPAYVVDDSDVERERRRLAGEFTNEEIGQKNRDAFGDRGGLIKGLDWRE